MGSGCRLGGRACGRGTSRLTPRAVRRTGRYQGRGRLGAGPGTRCWRLGKRLLPWRRGVREGYSAVDAARCPTHGPVSRQDALVPARGVSGWGSSTRCWRPGKRLLPWRRGMWEGYFAVDAARCPTHGPVSRQDALVPARGVSGWGSSTRCWRPGKRLSPWRRGVREGYSAVDAARCPTHGPVSGRDALGAGPWCVGGGAGSRGAWCGWAPVSGRWATPRRMRPEARCPDTGSGFRSRGRVSGHRGSARHGSCGVGGVRGDGRGPREAARGALSGECRPVADSAGAAAGRAPARATSRSRRGRTSAHGTVGRRRPRGAEGGFRFGHMRGWARACQGWSVSGTAASYRLLTRSGD